MRFINCLLSFILCYIFSEDLLISLSVFLITGAGNLINDFFDWDIDSKKGKKRLINNRYFYVFFSILLFIFGIVLVIGKIQFYIAIFASILLIIYSSLLKKYKYIGNLVVALLCALVPIYGTIPNISMDILIISLIIFVSTYVREVIKDFEDLLVDKGYKITLPMISKKLGKTVVFLSTILTTLLIICYLLFIYQDVMISSIVFISYIAFILAIFEFLQYANYTSAQKLVKLSSAIFIIALMLKYLFNI